MGTKTMILKWLWEYILSGEVLQREVFNLEHLPVKLFMNVTGIGSRVLRTGSTNRAMVTEPKSIICSRKLAIN
ncbi:hypothetical protein M0802_016406 [Mischocyttarus mexicanus]|nr:hypothetical protein M0802_016406 [Mischocyttarus mexicanus]